ncbi:unnamed protein product, partial [Bubo scandiacus]
TVSMLGNIVTLLLQMAYLSAIAVLVEKLSADQANTQQEKCEFGEYLLGWLLMQNQSQIQFSCTNVSDLNPAFLNSAHYSSGECFQCKSLTVLIGEFGRGKMTKNKAMLALQGTEESKYSLHIPPVLYPASHLSCCCSWQPNTRGLCKLRMTKGG